MNEETIKNIEDEKFRRLTGVKRSPFEKMLDILREAEGLKKAKGGGKNTLILEDRLVISLEYIRQYPYLFPYKSKRWGQ
ncbi:hypothetical protein HCUR_00667 [Holospora curviuscula]|uniref:Transposase Helix-turn-helix domain-containing protein n=1 Tax=Holospora curviuscula TaxID=1082868 RepID=A0A2S5R9A6_9PROT|nr:hypothetical protein HCUR_00667 [Holospora curviuscula]